MRDNRALADALMACQLNGLALITSISQSLFIYNIMARTINGIGTTFYGKCKFHADQSFITTKWVVLVFIPIVPLASYRFIEESSSSFEVVDADLPLEIMQVLRTWLFVALLGFAINLSDKHKLDGPGMFMLIGMICLLPFIMRLFAKRNAGL